MWMLVKILEVFRMVIAVGNRWLLAICMNEIRFESYIVVYPHR
jgi:hypothetical protein